MPVVTARLADKGAKFKEKGWAPLRGLIEKTYGRALNKVQLQASLSSRRQSTEESVSEYADALEKLATQLGTKLDDLTGVFVSGLQEAIVSAGMESRNFDSFEDALKCARTIEENQAARRPRAATRILQTPGLRAPALNSSPIMSISEDPAVIQTEMSVLLAALAQQNQAGSRPGPIRRGKQFRSERNSNSSAPFYRGPGKTPTNSDQTCSFCSYKGHLEHECRLKAELDKRKRKSGMLLTLYEPTSLGPLMTTSDISIGGAYPTTLIDSGATGSFIRESMLPHLGHVNPIRSSDRVFMGGNNALVPHTGTVEVMLTMSPRLRPFQ